MMQINVVHGSIQESAVDTIIVNLFQGVNSPGGATGVVDRALDGAISEIIASGDLSGKAGEIAVLYPRGVIPATRVLVVGLGNSDHFNLEGVRRAAAEAIKKAETLGSKHAATIIHGAGIAGLPVVPAAEATALGSLLASYKFDADKQKEDGASSIETLSLVEFDAAKAEEAQLGIAAAAAIAHGVFTARDLVNMPPNVATPTKMAEAARQIADEFGMNIVVGGRKWAAKHNMGAFLAVAKGAGEKPKFILLEHNGDDEELDTIVLVGKGITFDTGGISIKPSERMGLMKSDMGGAAAVLGAMRAVGELDLPLRVIGITPCTENMPDADAYRPADVIKASNGKTIEIISTDAEGRMVLADGLVFASHYEPDAVIDLATLTGACVVALGRGMSAGLFSTDDALRDALLAAGDAVQERVWPLPLWDDYKEFIKSDVADVKNSGGRMSGVASSAIFLKEFTDYPWAHLDIAGMALNDKPRGYIPRGATGFGVRILVEFLRNWAKK